MWGLIDARGESGFPLGFFPPCLLQLLPLFFKKILFASDLDLVEERNPQHWCDTQKVYIISEHLPLFIRIRSKLENMD